MTRLAMPMPLRLMIGLEKHGKARRRHAVRAGIETLAHARRDLVVDPAMVGYQSQASLSSVGMFTSGGQARARSIAGAKVASRSAWRNIADARRNGLTLR
jgi:hypothetical protein